MNQSKERLFMFGIIAAMTIWGLSWSSAKVLTRYSSAANIAFMRYIVVLLTLTPIMFATGTKFTIYKNGIKSLLGASLIMAVYSLLFFYGLKFGNSGASGVIITTINPIFAYLIGLVISRRNPNRLEWLGLLLGLIAGITLLNLWNGIELLYLPQNYIFLLAAFSWALMSKFSAHASRHGHPLTVSYWINVVTTVVLIPTLDFSGFHETLTVKADGLFWLNIIYFGAINTALATSFYIIAGAKIGPEKISGFTFLVPISGVFFAWLLLDETAEWFTIIGGVLGVVAVLIMNKKIQPKLT